MITTTLTNQPNGSGVCAPASSGEFVRYHGRRWAHVAPVTAPATGEVRPRMGDSSLIAAPKGMGMAWGNTWRPPD